MLGNFADVEEVRRLEVRVALRLAGIHRVHRDGGFEELLVTSVLSKWTEPVTLLNAPRTVDTIMCFTANCALVCAESNTQSEVGRTGERQTA